MCFIMAFKIGVVGNLGIQASTIQHINFMTTMLQSVSAAVWRLVSVAIAIFACMLSRLTFRRVCHNNSSFPLETYITT